MRFIICVLLFIYTVNSSETEIRVKTKEQSSGDLTIAAIGNTGVGKSSLLNLLADEDAFVESDTAEPVTKITEEKGFHLLGNTNDIVVKFIDTQGLQENSLKDSDNIANMVNEFRRTKRVNLFLLCLDSGNPRYTDYLDSTIKTFIRIFGEEFLDHVVLVFNKWNYAVFTDKEKAKRQSEYQAIMRQKFNIKDIPCFFIDSHYNRKKERIDPHTGESEYSYLSKRLIEKNEQEIFQFVAYLKSKRTVLNSEDAHRVKSHHDFVLEELRKSIQKYDQEREREREHHHHHHHSGYGQLGIVGNIIASLAGVAFGAVASIFL